LLSGSPAIDAGSNALVPVGTVTDQRGFPRIINGTVDVGAFEYGDGVALTIDIKPGGYPNAVNPSAKGVLPVAILTTDDFDALTVDYTTVEFGPSGIGPARPAKAKDVDGDGDLDLIMHFRLPDTGIACGDIEAGLTAMVFGVPAAGADDIVTVSCGN
jgi:hypothetical protein